MDAEIEFPEMEFHREEFLSLHIPIGLEEQSYDYLTRQVSRHPKTLPYHLCRIKVAITRHEEAVYGALIDLIWVLEDKGRNLQKRMVSAARKWLSEDRYDLLTQYLFHRLPCSSLPFSHCSVLHDGSWGDVEFLVEPQSARSAGIDLLQVANDCLELGQIDQASEILEDLVSRLPENSQARQALLEIYRATRDTERFLRSYRALETQGHLDPAWREAFETFKVQGY